MTQDDGSKGIKVTDRRMFTPEGELREPGNEVTAESVEPAPSAPGGDEPTTTEDATLQADEPSHELPQAGFADLVSILVEPIALFLGDSSLPDGKSVENLELARFHIDLLDVLKRKTESNLSSDERALLDDLLYRLRMRYVQKSS